MEAGLKIAKSLELCIEFQLREERSQGTKFFRFQMMVNLTKPLKHISCLLTPDGVVHMGLFKYECLPTFCFYCGLIGHKLRDCEDGKNTSIAVKDMAFGSWLGGVYHVFLDQLFALKNPLTHSGIHIKVP